MCDVLLIWYRHTGFLHIQSQTSISSVSSLPTSTDVTMAEAVEPSADFDDDDDSVVSYASFVEVTEMDTVEQTLTKYAGHFLR